MSNSNVYQLIAAVSADIAKSGISKSNNNQQQGYKFRGIDDVYNALAPIISKHGLVIVPRILSRELTERESSNKRPLFTVVVDAEFDFISSHDGSKHTAKTYGEAMDMADKATNKAMSAAYKYAAFQTFCIPTEGDNDADSTTHEVAAKQVNKLSQEQVKVINDLLAKAGVTDSTAFCSIYKVNSVADMTADMFEAAKKRIQHKISEMADVPQ